MTKTINAKGFYFNLSTLQKSDSPKEGYVYFSSILELKTYRKLKSLHLDFFFQYSIPLIESTTNHKEHSWKADFLLCGSKVIVESKGDWIIKPSFKGERAHFLMNHQLAELKGFKVVLVNTKAFNLNRKIKVHSLTDLNHDLLQKRERI